MTHILVNPGYSNYRRSKTLDTDLLLRRKEKKQLLTPCEFNRIRSESRRTWQSDWEDPGKPCVEKVGEFTTTYSVRHNHKILDMPTKSRPTSPTRQNNPHPTKVFLHLHMLKNKGYPSSKLKPEPFYTEKYSNHTRPVPPGTMYYTLKDIKYLQRTGQTETLSKIMNAERPNESWLNTPSRGIRCLGPVVNNRSEENVIGKTIENTFKPQVVPSLHRWLKQAGKEEKDATTDLLKSLAFNSKRRLHLNNVDPDRYVLRQYETTPRVTIHRPYKTDFVIHPEFTST